MRDLVIFGAGGLGREIAAIARATGSWDVRAFVVEDPNAAARVDGIEVVHGAAQLRRSGYRGAVAIGVGDSSICAKIHAQIEAEALAWELPAIVHPSAIVERKSSTLGPGVIVAAGAILSVSVRLGAFTLVNMGAVLSHDVVTGEHVRIHPRAVLCGGVSVGEGALIGAGALVMQYRRVGADAQVGLGAVVVRDVEDRTVVAGNPARAVSRIEAAVR